MLGSDAGWAFARLTISAPFAWSIAVEDSGIAWDHPPA